MEESTQDRPTVFQLWVALVRFIDAATEEPTDANLEAVSHAALKWATACLKSTRDATWLSSPEHALYKDKGAPEVDLDHLGREIHHGADGVKIVQSTVDNERLADDDDPA